MITRSLENRVFTVTANRVGTEERVTGKSLRFIGKSQVTAPDGRVLARASGSGRAVRVVEIDPRQARNKMITPANHVLRDIRWDILKRS